MASKEEEMITIFTIDLTEILAPFEELMNELRLVTDKMQCYFGQLEDTIDHSQTQVSRIDIPPHK